MDYCFLPKVLVVLTSTMFVAKTCLAYFLREELDFPPPKKPPCNNVNIDIRVLLKIPREKMVKTTMSNDEYDPNQFYRALTVDVNYTC